MLRFCMAASKVRQSQLSTPIDTLTQAAAQAEADAQAAKKAAAAAQAEADAILAAYNKLLADVGTINTALGTAKISGFPLTNLTATPLSAGGASGSSGSTGSTGTGSTGSTGTGSTGSTGTGSTGSTGSSGQSGAQAAMAAAAAANGGSSANDSVTAATVSGVSNPVEVAYIVNGPSTTVTYRYSDGSTFVRPYYTAPTNNNDGTYKFTFNDKGLDNLIWSGSGKSATGLVSTGSTSNGAAFLIGTGVYSGTTQPFVQAQQNSPTTTWQEILADGTSGSKGSPVTTTSGANTIVTFSDGTTFTHS